MSGKTKSPNGRPPVFRMQSIAERKRRRRYSSVFQAWSPVDTLPNEDPINTLARHDLAWVGLERMGLRWDSAHYGEGTALVADGVGKARAMRERLCALNPNLILLTEIRYRDAPRNFLPADHRWWRRNASHGGRGASSGAPRPTYGSVLQPTTQGSGNKTGSGSNPGAGAVELSVTGATTINGAIRANSAAGGRKAAGGSVRITTGTLAGSGIVDASAGGTDQAGAGGGRIAVRLTAGTSFGSVVLKAYGGSGGATQGSGAAGTVSKQTAADAANGGIVLVDNTNLATNRATFTPLPAFATSAEDLGKTQWVAQNKGKIGLVTHVAVESLTLGADTYLELAGQTATVSALRIANSSFGAGTYTAAALGPLVTDSSGGSGRVVVKARGTMVLLR